MQLVNKDTNGTNLARTSKAPKLAHELAHERKSLTHKVIKHLLNVL